MKIKLSVLRTLKKHPVWTGLAVVVLGVLLLLAMGGKDEHEQAAYHKVKRSDFLVSIVEGGTLQAVDEVVVRNELEGNARIIRIVKEGSYVEKGDLIVELDAGEAEDALNAQQILFEKSRAEFVAAQNDLIIVKSTVDSNFKTAELNVEFADMDVRKFDEIEKSQQVRDAEIEIITAKEALEIAKEKLRWSKVLKEKGFESKATLDKHALEVTNQSLGLEKAENTQAMLTAFDLQKLEKTYEAALSEARRELERVKKQGESLIAQAEADLSSAEATLGLNDAKLKKMKEQFKATKLYAPQDGLIVYATERSRYSSETMIEEGAQVRQRQQLIKIPDTSQMKVDVKVSETHIGQIRTGQPVFVVIDSMPDKSYRGEVTKVGLLPDSGSRWGGGGVKEYSTEILIADELPDVKPGVSAQAEIVITNLQDVLTVPIQSVTTIKGTQYCYRKGFGGSEPVPVEVGLFNTKFIEITKGLAEGDEVLLAPPLEPDSDFGGGSEHAASELGDLPTGRPSPQSGRPEGQGSGAKPGAPGARPARGGRPESGGAGSGAGERTSKDPKERGGTKDARTRSGGGGGTRPSTQPRGAGEGGERPGGSPQKE